MNKMDNNNEVNQNNQNQTSTNNHEELNNSSSANETEKNNEPINNTEAPNNNEVKTEETKPEAPVEESKPQTLDESWAVIADLKHQLDDEKNASKLLGTQINKLHAGLDSLQTARALETEKYNHDLDDAKKAIAARLQTRIEEWRKQDEEDLKHELERLNAEYKEKENDALAPYAKKLVEILSLFSHVIHNFRLEGQDEAVIQYNRGMQSIHDKFYALLKDINVEQMKINIGDQFDEARMKAIDTIASDKYHHNQIIEVKKPGFTLNGKVIQFAEVVVAK